MIHGTYNIKLSCFRPAKYSNVKNILFFIVSELLYLINSFIFLHPRSQPKSFRILCVFHHRQNVFREDEELRKYVRYLLYTFCSSKGSMKY